MSSVAEATAPTAFVLSRLIHRATTPIIRAGLQKPSHPSLQVADVRVSLPLRSSGSADLRKRRRSFQRRWARLRLLAKHANASAPSRELLSAQLTSAPLSRNGRNSDCRSSVYQGRKFSHGVARSTTSGAEVR